MIRSFKRIMAWVGSRKGRVYAGFLLSVVIAVATASPTFIAAWVLGSLVADARGEAPIDSQLIWVSLLAIAACVVIRFIFTVIKSHIQESVGYETAADERLAVGDVLKRVPLGYFQQMKIGDILTGVTTNLNMLELEGVRRIDGALEGYVSAAIITLWLFRASPLCGAISLFAILLVSFTLIAVNRAAARLTPAAKTATERLSGAVVELYRGLGTAKSYGTNRSVLRPYTSSVDDLCRARIDIELGYTPPNVTHKLILEVASVTLVVAAVSALVAGSLQLWEFFGIALFSATIFGSIERLTDSAHIFADLSDSLDRIEAIEDAEFIDADGSDVKLDSYGIGFDKVCFSYGEREVLHDVTFDIPQGTTCAIVGPSGSGKTTISSLMARFYDVDSGAVRVGGHDVREFTVDSLLRNFSMVFQDVYLFNDTLEANIAFGTAGATHEQVVEAAKRARCHDFISALPNGYDTIVGEGGASLSGGERQRVSIARALLKDAPIVVLDEATASIDPENEQLIQQALTELTREKTVVVIAHRLATIEHADQILVVEDGTVIQRGTHEELLAQEGVYRRFVEARAEVEGWKIG